MMKRFLRRALAAALAAAMALTLTGCWDYREVESLQFVSGIAVDKGSSKRYRLTLELLDLTGNAQGSSTLPGKLAEAEGDTIADAVANAAMTVEGELYFNDCKLAVFSREIAENGLTSALDWLNRDPQPRFTMQLYVSLEREAADILQPESKGGAAVSPHISAAMQQANSMGRNTQVCLYEADNILLGEGTDLALPCLKREQTPDGNWKAAVSGLAVFRGDRLAGYRDEEQTRIDMLLTSSVRKGQFVVKEDNATKNISLTIRDSSAAIQPVTSGNLGMSVAIKAECTYDEENTSANLLQSAGLLSMESTAASALNAASQAEVRSVQSQLGCDIFGFGRAVSQKGPGLWKKLKPHWRETFRTLKVDVSARVHITNSGYAYPKGKR